MRSLHWIASLFISALVYPRPSLSLNSNCYFTTDDKNKAIDMQSQNAELTADGTLYDFKYKPCEEFELDGGHGEYLVWQQEKSVISPRSFGLGKNPRLQSNGEGKYSLEMTGEGGRKTTVRLVCDKTKTGKAAFTGGESSTTKVYRFNFVH